MLCFLQKACSLEMDEVGSRLLSLAAFVIRNSLTFPVMTLVLSGIHRTAMRSSMNLVCGRSRSFHMMRRLPVTHCTHC